MAFFPFPPGFSSKLPFPFSAAHRFDTLFFIALSFTLYLEECLKWPYFSLDFRFADCTGARSLILPPAT